MKLFVVAGEASGDLHGANLLRAIRHIAPTIRFEGFGGPRMEAEGMTVLRGLDKLAFMGFSEVVMNLGTVMQNFAIAKKAITEQQPDALLLIDYPGFNLRLAKWARKRNIPVLYYIAPQAWAWKESRVNAMRTDIHQLMVILPFEQQFFAKHGIAAHFVGHPLLDVMKEESGKEEYRNTKYKIQNTNSETRNASGQTDVKGEIEERTSHIAYRRSSPPLIALLPGSRQQEVRTMLPAMLAVRSDFAHCRFVIGKAPGLSASLYKDITVGHDVEVYEGGTQALLQMAHAALVTSGTATLETALLGVPQLVCYRGNALSVMLARKLIKVKYIALANLILDRQAIAELIQDQLNAPNLSAKLHHLLTPQAHTEAQDIKTQLWTKLGGAGASANAARIIVHALGKH